MARSVVIATRSEGKIRELIPILAARGFAVDTVAALGIPEAPDEAQIEQFNSFEANALAKARYFAALLPNAVIVADDSGLVVDALGGRPGVASKRWSNRPDLSGDALDDANNAHLLQELRALGATTLSSRSARYVCAMACCIQQADTREVVARGSCEGPILASPRGSSGFGYDPLFFSIELGRSFGEAKREEKAQVSHRARALSALLDLMEETVGG